MVRLLQSVADYKPNEVEMQVAGLEALLASLRDLNHTAVDAGVNLRQARTARNLFFYAKDTGMIAIVKKAKGYIAAIYGKVSQNNDAATAIRFVRIVTKRKTT